MAAGGIPEGVVIFDKQNGGHDIVIDSCNATVGRANPPNVHPFGVKETFLKVTVCGRLVGYTARQ